LKKGANKARSGLRAKHGTRKVKTGNPASKKDPGRFFGSNELKEFLAVLAATDVVEFEYGEKGAHIVIKRESVGEIIGDEMSPARENPHSGEGNRKEYRIKSTAVGLFHLVENDVPLCSVGDVVKKGKRLGWVESMGIPKEIVAERDGRIAAIACEDCGVVEWGQDLFEVEDV